VLDAEQTWSTASRLPQTPPVERIDFRDGSSCSPPSCTAVPGYSPPAQALPPREKVAARVKVTARKGRRQYTIRVRWKARVAITDATATYQVRLFRGGGSSSIGFTQRNITAGEDVVYRFPNIRGGRTYRFRVSYHYQDDLTFARREGVTVGRARLTLP
jgi:hypothetical protein